MKFNFKIVLILLLGFLFFYGSKKNEKGHKETRNLINKEKQPNVLIIFPDQLRRYSAGYWSKEPFRSLVYSLILGIKKGSLIN
jgi:hypothetical protein